jgi:hypothetical protein
MLGLPPGERYWAYDFWSRQFLGTVPSRRVNPNSYEHPGDVQDLVIGDAPDVLDIAFFGPCVKLICLKKPRSHPWVVGTSFHQSCGSELESVTWSEPKNSLSGMLRRPPGEKGSILFTTAGKRPVSAEVDHRQATFYPAANGSYCLSVTSSSEGTAWRLKFEND